MLAANLNASVAGTKTAKLDAIPHEDPAVVAVAAALDTAFVTTGFAVIVGHGVPDAMGSLLYEKSSQFHGLPAGTKRTTQFCEWW